MSDLRPNRALKELIESTELEGLEQKVVSNKIEIVEEIVDSIKEEILEARLNADEESVLVSLIPPEGGKRTPSDIICVIDVSGSMGTEATIKDNKGDVETFGLT